MSRYLLLLLALAVTPAMAMGKKAPHPTPTPNEPSSCRGDFLTSGNTITNGDYILGSDGDVFRVVSTFGQVSAQVEVAYSEKAGSSVFGADGGNSPIADLKCFSPEVSCINGLCEGQAVFVDGEIGVVFFEASNGMAIVHLDEQIRLGRVGADNGQHHMDTLVKVSELSPEVSCLNGICEHKTVLVNDGDEYTATVVFLAANGKTIVVPKNYPINYQIVTDITHLTPQN